MERCGWGRKGKGEVRWLQGHGARTGQAQLRDGGFVPEHTAAVLFEPYTSQVMNNPVEKVIELYERLLENEKEKVWFLQKRK